MAKTTRFNGWTLTESEGPGGRPRLVAEKANRDTMTIEGRAGIARDVLYERIKVDALSQDVRVAALSDPDKLDSWEAKLRDAQNAARLGTMARAMAAEGS